MVVRGLERFDVSPALGIFASEFSATPCSRPSLVGRCTSTLCMAENFSSALRAVSPGACRCSMRESVTYRPYARKERNTCASPGLSGSAAGAAGVELSEAAVACLAAGRLAGGAVAEA